jgi:hypothetical protein
VWALLKRRVEQRHHPRTIEELQDAIHDEWACLPVEELQNLIDSMPRRCAQVVAADGHRIGY